MTLTEMLLQIRDANSALREQAAGELEVAISRLCPVSDTMDKADRQDIVSEVMLTLLEMLARDMFPVLMHGDGVIRAYLGTMVRNRFKDEWNRQKRFQRKDPEDPSNKQQQNTPEVKPPGGIQQMMDTVTRHATQGLDLPKVEQMMETVLRHAVQGRPERYRAPLEQAWAEAIDLCLNDVPMEEIVARNEGITPATPPEGRVRARDRVLQRQRRLRKALGESVENLENEGVLSAEAAHMARHLCTAVLLRRQKNASRESK